MSTDKAADRPSVTDNACPELRRDLLADYDSTPGLIARGVIPDPDDDLHHECGRPWEAHEDDGVQMLCPEPAETTTATDEDKTVIERAATVITANTDEPMWSAVVIAKELDARGLLATARTETTTATDEDALGFRVEDRAGVPVLVWMPQGGCRPATDAEVTMWGLLATARTRPTREQIARALDHAGAFCGECGAEPGDFFDSCLECQRWLLNYADAVLTLLESGER